MFYVVKGKEKLDPRTEPNQREGRLEPEGAQPRGWEVFWGRGEAHGGLPPSMGALGVSCSLARAPWPVRSRAGRLPVAQGASASPLHPHQKQKKKRKSQHGACSPPPQRRGQGCVPPAQPVLQGTGHGGEPCSPWDSQKLGFQHRCGQLRLPAGAQAHR